MESNQDTLKKNLWVWAQPSLFEQSSWGSSHAHKSGRSIVLEKALNRSCLGLHSYRGLLLFEVKEPSRRPLEEMPFPFQKRNGRKRAQDAGEEACLCWGRLEKTSLLFSEVGFRWIKSELWPSRDIPSFFTNMSSLLP